MGSLATYSLDLPARPADGGPAAGASPLLASGWLLPPDGRTVRSIDVYLGDRVLARTGARISRPDVARAFSDRAGAAWSGFVLEVPLDDQIGRTVDLDFVARWDGGSEAFHRQPVIVLGRAEAAEVSRRPRAFDLAGLLACPTCGAAGPDLGPRAMTCGACGAAFGVRRGTPILAPAGEPICSRLLEPNRTHPYGDDALEIIRDCAGGLVLDFGAGNPAPENLFPHVVLHEALHYTQTDVVSVLPRLPYRDGVFDAVVSQAVFEHVDRPWEVADELYRVLKPGGRIHVDTAFMQPFHADPSHFFNMTTSGVRQVFRRFLESAVGVKPYQAPSYGLRMQLDVMLEHLEAGLWRDRVARFRAELDEAGLDAAFDADGYRYQAAGVYFDGVKPEAA